MAESAPWLNSVILYLPSIGYNQPMLLYKLPMDLLQLGICPLGWVFNCCMSCNRTYKMFLRVSYIFLFHINKNALFVAWWKKSSLPFPYLICFSWTEGVWELDVPLVVHPLEWFHLSSWMRVLHFVPCFPLFWVLRLIYGWRGFIKMSSPFM